MHNGMIAAIGAGLLAVGSSAGAQAVVGPVPSGPAPGSGDSARMSADSREMNAAINERLGSANLSKQPDQRKSGKPSAVPATASDIKVGSPLRDVNGVAIGTIVALDGDQAVVDTGQTKIKVPLVAFGKDDRGLLLGITAARFNELVANAKASN